MLEKKQVPVLRFAEFDEKWKKQKLIDISINGFTNGAFNDPRKVGSGYRIINVKDMFLNSTIVVDNLERVALDEKEFLRNKVEYGDIFFTRSSLVKAGIAFANVNLSKEGNLTYDGHLIKMSPDKTRFSPFFLYNLFKTPNSRKQFIVRGKTATMTTIGQEDISDVVVIFPSLPEQQKIASFLTEVDTKLSQLTKKKALLENYKKGVMKQIFSQEIRFKDGDGNAFADWEEKNLVEVCDVRDGTHDSPNYVKKGYPLITSKNLNANGKLDFDDVSFVNGIDFININKRSKVDVNDIIFGMIGTIGNPVLLKEDGFAIKNVALIKEKKQLKNIFLIHFLKSNHIAKQFHRQNSGGTQKFIALGVIRNLKVLVPSFKEQTKIANFLSDLDAKIEVLSTSIENTETFKKGLLQQMFV
jgi:type I restriction enzyme S subunit